MQERPTREEILEKLKTELPYLQERYGVERIAIFGSFAKGEGHKTVILTF